MTTISKVVKMDVFRAQEEVEAKYRVMNAATRISSNVLEMMRQKLRPSRDVFRTIGMMKKSAL